MTTGKTIALTIQTSVGQMMSLLFNTLDCMDGTFGQATQTAEMVTLPGKIQANSYSVFSCSLSLPPVPPLHLLPVPPIGQTHVEARGQGCPLIQSVEVSPLGRRAEWRRRRMDQAVGRDAGERGKSSGMGCECEMSVCCRFHFITESPVAQMVKNPPSVMRLGRCGFDPWVRKIPWSRKWQPTLVSLLGESHGQRSLVGYSP